MIINAKIVMYTKFCGLTMYLSTKLAMSPRQPSPEPRNCEKITGSSRIELAKMIGITPDWLTLSGM